MLCAMLAATEAYWAAVLGYVRTLDDAMAFLRGG